MISRLWRLSPNFSETEKHSNRQPVAACHGHRKGASVRSAVCQGPDHVGILLDQEEAFLSLVTVPVQVLVVRHRR